MKDSVLILGLPASHRPGWGLIKDGKILRAIQEERLNRIKNYPYNTDLNKYPMSLGIDYLFKGQDFNLCDCDAATVPRLPVEKKYHNLIFNYNQVDNSLKLNKIYFDGNLYNLSFTRRPTINPANCLPKKGIRAIDADRLNLL